MPVLNITTVASATVMGAQVYEEAVAGRAQSSLDAREPGWRVRRTVLRSITSTLPGTHRLPMGWVLSASAQQRRLVGRMIYPRGALTHRMKVGIPPSPERDVLTLHDVTPWKYPDEAPPPRAAKEEIARASAIITVSEFSADEIAELFGVPRPTVIPNGVDERLFFASPLEAGERATLGLSAGAYVLVARGATERKNLAAMASAWRSVRRARPDLTLVLSGPDHPRRTDLFRGLDGVRLVGRVPDVHMPGLLAGAESVVVPSLYEGFGLPALEGMAVGVPVVAASTSSLPEVVGDAGILVDPTGERIAEGILWATSGDPEVSRLAAAGREHARQFTWARSAEAHAALWSSLV